MNNKNEILTILLNMRNKLENCKPGTMPSIDIIHGLCWLLDRQCSMYTCLYSEIMELILKYNPKNSVYNAYWFPTLGRLPVTQKDIDMCITPRLTIINNVIKDLK